MQEVAIITTSGFVAIMILITVGLMVSMIIRASKGGRKQSSGEEVEETRLIQEVHNGLLKMEKRVESLETLLIERDRDRQERFNRELEH